MGAVDRLQPDLYSETEYPRVAGWAPLQALTDGRWKTIRAGAATEVYDLQNDPRELRDLSSSQPNGVAAMSARIAALRAGSTPAARSITPEAEQRLRALGYVACLHRQQLTRAHRIPRRRLASGTRSRRRCRR